MRRLLPLLTILTVSCSSVCQPEIESLDDIPVTLKAVNALHDPPTQTVVIERQTRSRMSGGGGCGHAIACVILLPFFAYDALFPEKWDDVTVTGPQGVWFEAKFSTKGDFLSGTYRTDTKTLRLQLFDLRELGRRVVLKTYWAPAGKDHAFQKVSILEQLPLDADYEQAIEAEKKPEKRRRLALEALGWLGKESEGVFDSYLKGLKGEELDDALPYLIEGTCAPEPFEGACRKVTVLVAGEVSDKALNAIFKVGSSAKGAIEGEDLKKAVSLAFDRLCDLDQSSKIDLDQLRDLVQKGQVGDLRPSCSSDARKSVLRLALGETLSTEELLLTVGDPLLEQAIDELPQSHEAYTDFVIEAVTADPTSVPISSKLSRIGVIDQAQLKSLTMAYIASADTTSFSASAHQLEALKKGSETNETDGALRLLSAETKSPALLIARAVLGERKLEGEAAAVLGDGERFPYGPEFVYSRNSLIAFGLRLNGCDSAAIRARKKSGQICKP